MRIDDDVMQGYGHGCHCAKARMTMSRRTRAMTSSGRVRSARVAATPDTEPKVEQVCDWSVSEKRADERDVDGGAAQNAEQRVAAP